MCPSENQKVAKVYPAAVRIKQRMTSCSCWIWNVSGATIALDHCATWENGMRISALKLAGHPEEQCEDLQPLLEGTEWLGFGVVQPGKVDPPPCLDFGSPSVRVKRSAVFLVGMI